MTAPRDPHLRPDAGRHRAPIIPKPPRRFRKRHVAVVAAAMVGMAWLPAELADVAIAPPEAVAAEERPGNDTAVIHRTPAKAPRTAVERRTGPAEGHRPSEPPTPTAEPVSAAPTTATVTTTPTPVAEPPMTTTAAAPTTAASLPPKQSQTPPTTPAPRPTWPPNCGGGT